MRNTVIFALPCAGGRAANFKRWNNYIDFKFVSLEYPGHWERWNELLNDDYMAIADDVESQILEYTKNHMVNDIYIVGHSMGALLTCIVAQKESLSKLIKGIVLIAMVAPNKAKDLRFKDLTNEIEIKSFLREIRQVPEKILVSDFFVDNLLPSIKNDFRLFNNMIQDITVFSKIRVPCLVMYSEDDPIIKKDEITVWSDYAENTTYEIIGGNHFFPYSQKYIPMICEIINKYINSNY